MPPIAIGFAYAFDGNADGMLDGDTMGRIHWGVIGRSGNWIDLDTDADNQIGEEDDTDKDGIVDGIDTGVMAKVEDVRMIKIWLLGRAPQKDPHYGGEQRFVIGDRVLTFNDQYRRRLLQTSVSCRNLGI